MSRSVWARNITPGELVHLAPASQDLCINNLALSRESSDLGRTSLTLSFILNNGKISTPVTICTLMLGRTDQISTNLRLVKGRKYILQVEGPNSISMIGFYDLPFPQGTTSAVSLSRVSQSNELSVMGSKPIIGMRTEPVGMRAEPMNESQGVDIQAEPADVRADSIRAQSEFLGMRGETVRTQVGAVGAKGEAVRTLAEAQIVRPRPQNVRMRAEAEAVGMQAKPVGAAVEAIGTRAEAAQVPSLNVSTTRTQHTPQTIHGPAVTVQAPSRVTKSMPLQSKNMLKLPSGPSSAVTPVTPAIESTPTASRNARIPTSFPFMPSLGSNSKAAHHTSPAGDPGEGIYDSMHAPKTSGGITHAFNPTNPGFRFDTSSMLSAEAPISNALTLNSESLIVTGGASSIKPENRGLGRLTPMSADKGKKKAYDVEIVSHSISVGDETDIEDI
ncbi:hypothetical protein EV360DRAFT_73781 [Lentinula raphanica]|nr:hypothetical protein EV360DRAFT_73781 [Lentinula raphanica]